MKHVATAHGLSPKVPGIQSSALKSLQMPIIARVDSNSPSLGHFAVVFGVSTDWFEVIDGPNGAVTQLSMVDFLRQWNGYVLADVPDAGPLLAVARVPWIVCALLPVVAFFPDRLSKSGADGKKCAALPLSTYSLVMLFVLLVPTYPAVGDDNRIGPNVLQSIEDSLKAQYDSLESIHVQYRYSVRLVGSADDANRFLRIKVLQDDTHEYALKGNKRYFSVMRSNSLADSTVARPAVNSSDSPAPKDTVNLLANSISAFDGTVLRRRHAGGDSASIGHLAPDKSDARFFGTYYLQLVSRIPPDIANPSLNNSEFRLLDAIRAGRCTVRSEPELVDGHQCVVVDWAGELRKVLWLDPSIGYAIRKRELYYANTDLLMWRTMIVDFFAARDGMSWPRKATSEYFAGPDAPARLHNVALVAYDYDVSRLALNNVPDELFELKIPPGIPVVDFANGRDDPNTGRRYGTMMEASPTGELIERRIETVAPQTADNSLRTKVIAANLLILLIAACWWFWRRSNRN
jgi:hypothetical protein